MKFFTKEVKIALVAIVGIVLLFFGLNFLKGRSLFSDNSHYYIRFNNISGLSASDPIFADGYQVGVVQEVTYDFKGNKGAYVMFDADKQLRIPKGTKAEIMGDIMGNVKINLLLSNTSNEFCAPGDTIMGFINTGVVGTVGELMPVVQNILPKLDSILSNVNAITGDPALKHSVQNLQVISANLAETSQKINLLTGSLNRQVPGLLDKTDIALTQANATLTNTNKITSEIAQMDIAGTMSKVDKAITHVQSITKKLDSNDGTLGLLVNDPQLYRNLNSTLQSADSLLINLKAHPKRYVHFSLFGKKDK